MTGPVKVTIRPVVPEDSSDLPDGAIALIVTDEGEVIGYLPEDVCPADEEEG